MGQEGKRSPARAPNAPVPARGLHSHASFFFPFWEIPRILLFLASSQPLTDITGIRARNMLSPFPSCQRGPAALPTAHLDALLQARRNWGGSSEHSLNRNTCWSFKSTPANRATCFSLDFNSC